MPTFDDTFQKQTSGRDNGVQFYCLICSKLMKDLGKLVTHYYSQREKLARPLAVADNPVVVYSKSTCGYCTEARKLFDKERIPYFSYDIDKNEDGMDVFKSIHAVTKSRYVPQIFICGKYVGGYDVVEFMRDSGILHQEVQKCLRDQDRRH